MISAFSWQNCQPLPCFILYSKAKFACYSRYLLTSCFCIPVPYSEKDIFFGVLVLEGLLGPSFSFSFFSIAGWDIDLDYCDIEWFALETNRIILFFQRWHPRTAFQTLFINYEGYSISSKEFLPTVSELNSPISVHFSSLIPILSMFMPSPL